ncbi:MFS transporter [Adlercreutzia sp. ZJ141]|uniref:MFS transporter n=1 Tax=Adlercreutzia sp. ZJ141 TaxID=2709406 RepID=UPI0013ED709F|nr:MFS transporter [Adlercreutzia sp. ZJ141]
MAEIHVSAVEQQATLKKVVFSSFLGNFIEWFDYASYSYLATVIAVVFFPGEDKLVSTMSAFAVFALSFLVRPIGALFWGNMGDKKGRKWALSISILLMSGATFLIGCLPGYAVIGVGAPLLLLCLRCLQSFSASGEYAGASTFIAEFAPTEKRGLYVSAVPASTATGLLVGSFFATGMFAIFGAESDFVVNWGWRIPFLLALPLGYITHYIRTHLTDSPVYEEMVSHSEGGTGAKTPVRDVIFKYPRTTLICFGSAMLNAIGFYAVLTFMPNYLEAVLLYDPAKAGTITTIVLVAYIAMIFLSGHISDTFGRKKMLIIAAAGFIIFTVPAYMLLGTLNFAICLAVELFMALLLCINDGTLASYLNEQYPTEVRYTGFAFTFNLANAIFGGSCSAICLWLVDVTGNQLAPGFYFVAIAIIALIAIICSKEHSGTSLTEIHGQN